MPRRRRTAPASAASAPCADLPPELLRKIYGRLVFAEDLARFPAVCRPWRDAVADDLPLRFPPWADLPGEALGNIAGRLHAASDCVRFHTACYKWHATLSSDPPGCCLLPWLLAPSPAAGDNAAENQLCRCVFSKATYRAPGICVGDWRVAYADGTAAWLVRGKDETFLANPLTAQRLPLPVDNAWLTGRRHRIVTDDDGDYCALLYDFSPRSGFQGYVAHREIGDSWLRVSSDLSGSDRCCAAACHHGGYVVCVDLANCHVLRPSPEQSYKKCCYATSQVRAPLPEEPAGKVRRCSYLLEYRGELLLASVLRDRRPGGRLSVSLHELHLAAGQNNGVEEPEVEWVRRGQSDSDISLFGQELLFLGFPNSFTVEAAGFSEEVSGGAAYFVVEGNSAVAEPTLCSMYRYSFRDGTATLVERLPAGWHDASCMWFLPEPKAVCCHVLRPHWVIPADLPDVEPGKKRQCSYLLTYHGDLILASLLIDEASGYVSVSLHEFRLRTGHIGGEHLEVEWVRRDESDEDMARLDDHVLFLGFPASFAVEAARFGGELRGGAAYFVGRGWEGDDPCRVGRYSFRGGGVATVVETLPDGWDDTRCMWFLPETSSGDLLLQSSNRGGAQRRQQLTIYARNLSPKVDSSRLRETFSVYGKVASARVAYDRRGGWSREFGFVTMATQEGYDKAMAALNRPKAVKKAPAVDNSVTMLEWFLVPPCFFSSFWQFFMYFSG
ncbi:unnamed protein product [Urochloa decumbens]|uniref:RRM domain-containing protein n=1 Tax=Urochloa decumbens TaxID=240449 RepID=A0ABC8VU15_9POAL